ncbi:hypothetical protein [Trichodesmium erythraeum]
MVLGSRILTTVRFFYLERHHRVEQVRQRGKVDKKPQMMEISNDQL